MPFNESREVLWGKVRGGYSYAYNNFFDDVDWFLKGDDDSYFIMENLRYILYQYRPQTAIYIGHRYSVSYNRDGYMAGGGYILSKKATEKFVTKRMNEPGCSQGPGGAEDLEMGKCLEHHAIPLDAHNLLGQKQFFPIGPENYFNPRSPDFPTWWYEANEWENYTRGSLDCCADTLACVHYATPKEMHLINYLVYNTHPFGLIRDPPKLPRKLSLDEIIKASDVESGSPGFVKHEFVHNLEDDEKF